MTSLHWQAPWQLAWLGLLAIPLVVHLLHRGSRRRVELATIQWLAPRPRPSWHRLKLTQKALLFLRCALLAVAVLLLAGPMLKGQPGSAGKPWVLVDTTITPEAAGARLAELGEAMETGTDGVELRWLTPGFPEIVGNDHRLLQHFAAQPAANKFPETREGAQKTVPDSDSPGSPTAASRVGIWSLLQEADRLLPDGQPLGLIAPAPADRLGVRRPSLGRNLIWRQAPSTPKQPEGRVVLRLAVGASPAREAALEYFIAAAESWQARGVEVQLSELTPGLRPEAGEDRVPDEHPDWMVYLTDDEVPGEILERVERGGVLLTDGGAAAGEASVLGGPQIEPLLLGRGTVLTLSGGFAAQQNVAQHSGLLIDPNFPQWLVRQFAMAGRESPAAGLGVDSRQAQPSLQPGRAMAGPAKGLGVPLGWILLGLFLAERLVSARSTASARSKEPAGARADRDAGGSP